jgi:serine protease
MNNRHILPALGSLLLALVVCATAYAQEPATIRSAKMEAIAASGVMRNPNGDDMVAQAIYVKLRKGFGGTDPAAVAEQLASAAGLRTASATQIAAIRTPLDKDLAARIQGMPSEKRARIAEAEDALNRIIEIHYTSAMAPADAARLVAKLPQVEYAGPIFLPHPLGDPEAMPASTNDTHFPQQQAQLAQAKVLQAWDIWKGDTNMVIAVVDAGIDMMHEDLLPNIKENPGEVGTDSRGKDKRTNGVDDDQSGAIDDWRGANLTAALDGTPHGNTKGSSHGTQVAGLAAAATNNAKGVAGVGYLCKFFPIKTALASGGNLIRAYEGIIYAAKRGFKVINCSFGSDGYDPILQDIITNTVEAWDCAILGGAGNAVAYSEFYPAGYKHVLGVGALDTENGFKTTWGEQVGISSPAGFSTNDNNTYEQLSPATSYATPVASGVVALLRSKHPNLTADQTLAHLRLTSDILPTPSPDQYRLTGYGRLNAQRALSVDPFSHPGLFIDTVWMVDDNGAPMERAAVGKFARLKVRVRNILGDASNVRLRAATYTTDSAVVWLKDTALGLASIKSGEVKELEGSIPFQVRQPSTDRIHLRFDLTANAGYVDYHYERMLFYIPYITARTPNITVSLTDNGHIGFQDFPDNTLGEGFTYDGTPFLYEGGFIIASDQLRVMNNIRSTIDEQPQADFGAVEYPTASNNYTLTLNDAPAGDRRIGVELRVRLITSDTVPGGIAIQLRTKNTTLAAIDSLRIGLFLDWDLDNSDVGQSIEYKEGKPKSNVPFYGLITGESGYVVAEGVVAPAPLPIFYALRNDSLPIRIYDGFNTAQKYHTVSNGIGRRRAVLSDSSDVSLVIGKRVVGLAPGAEDTTLFVIGISTIEDEAIDNMRRMAPPAPVDTTTGGVDDPLVAGRGMLGAIQPNPFGSVTTINVVRAGRDAKLLVYDALGRIVADLTGELARSGAPSTILFDGSRLPAGVYQVQLAAPGATETRQIVIVH